MIATGTTVHVDRELTQRLMRSFAPPVALPEQLRNELVSTYSARLYGAPGRVSLDTLRIIWPALLGSVARAALRGTVLCSIPVHSLLRNESSLLARTQRRFAHHTYPFLPMRNFFINTNAILVHQPARAEHQPHTAGRAHDSISCKAKSVRTHPTNARHPKAPCPRRPNGQLLPCGRPRNITLLLWELGRGNSSRRAEPCSYHRADVVFGRYPCPTATCSS